MTETDGVPMSARQQAAIEEEQAIIVRMQITPGNPNNTDDLRRLEQLIPVAYPNPAKPISGPRASAGLPSPIRHTASLQASRPVQSSPGSTGIPRYWLGHLLGMTDYALRYGGSRLVPPLRRREGR